MYTIYQSTAGEKLLKAWTFRTIRQATDWADARKFNHIEVKTTSSTIKLWKTTHDGWTIK